MTIILYPKYLQASQAQGWIPRPSKSIVPFVASIRVRPPKIECFDHGHFNSLQLFVFEPFLFPSQALVIKCLGAWGFLLASHAVIKSKELSTEQEILYQHHRYEPVKPGSLVLVRVHSLAAGNGV